MEPTPEQVAFVDAVRREWANRFFFMTRGRAVQDTDSSSSRPSPSRRRRASPRRSSTCSGRSEPEGSWADAPGVEVRDTELAIEALVGFRGDPRAASATSHGAAHLAARSLSDADACARSRLAVAAEGSPGAAMSPACFEAAWLDPEGGVAPATGYRATIIDTVLSGLALGTSATVADQPVVAGIVAYLLAHQNGDGGWPYFPGGPSQIEPTAAVLRLLAQCTAPGTTWYAAQAAMTFFAARRLSDAGYGDVSSDPGLTAEVALALGAWSMLLPGDAASISEYLLATQRPDGSWETSVAETAIAVRALREFLTPNLAVIQVALAYASASDGEVVTANAQIENTGRIAVPAATVQAFDSTGRPFGPPVQIGPFGPGQRLGAVLTLDTSGHAGSTELFVVVNPSGTIDESSEADNRIALTFTVTAPPEAAESRRHLRLARDRTDGRDDAPIAAHLDRGRRERGALSCGERPGGGARPRRVRGSVRVDLPGRARVPVSIPVTVGAGAGDVPVEFVVDPLGELTEAREDNNSAAIVVPIVPSIDLRVASLSLWPAEVDQGGELHVSYVLANRGTAAAQVDVEVRMTDGAGRVVAVQLDRGVAVGGGGAATRSTTWRATVAGPVTVTVDASHPADLDPADNRATAATTIRASPFPDLALRPADLVASPDPALEGKPVTISATVRNVGGGAAPPFAVDFWLGAPATGTHLGRETSPGLAAGAEWTTVVSVPVSATAELVVHAVVDPDAAVNELDESDNDAVITIPVRPLPNLALGTGAFVLSTAFPRLGETVAVEVSVQNLGGQPSEPTTVELRYTPADGPERAVASAPLAAIEGGSSASVTLQWTASAEGSGTLAAVVNPARSALEASYDDDRAERSVLVQGGAVALTNPYFSPNGDGVKDETEIFWRASGATDVTVSVAPEKGDSPVRRLAGSGGSVVWDGRDDEGRVVRDGKYVLTTLGGSALLGSATAVVDTNRSPLHEAPRSMLETELVNALVYEGWPCDGRLLPDDSGIVLTGCGPARPDGGANCGLHLQRFDGTPPIYLNANAERFALSPDGSTVAYVAQDCSDATPRTPGCVSLHLVSIPGGEDRRIWEAPNRPHWMNGFYAPAFSPDGKRIAFIRGGSLEWQSILIEAVGVDGNDHRVVASGFDYDSMESPGWFWPQEIAYSPDGQWVSFKEFWTWIGLSRDGPPEHVILYVPQDQNEDEPDGSDRHLWIPGSREIALALEEGIFAIDTATGAARALVSPSSLDVTDPLMGRDGKLATDPRGEALAFPTGPAGEERWNADGRFRVMLSAPIGAPPKTFWETPVAGIEIDALAWSTSGATMAVGQWPWDYVRHVVRSLANLSTRLAAIQVPGTRRMTFRGTAADLNFERYEIRTRLLKDGELFRTVVTSSTPAVGAELGTWTPPAPGVYEATLVAFDKAGNARERRIRFTWGDASPIANLRRDPEYVSPNADGVQDAAVVSYTVVAPVTVSVTVSDDAGAVVRRLQRTHATEGDGSIAWDGTDDAGTLVRDGVYWLEVEGSRYRVVVDTVRPRVELALRNDSRAQGGVRVHGRDGVGEGDVEPVRDHPGRHLVRFPAGLRARDAAGHGREPPRLALGGDVGLDADVPRGRPPVSRVPRARPAGRPGSHVPGGRAGSSGNPASTSEQAYGERLFLLGFGDEALTNWCAPKHGLLNMGYPSTFEVYPGLFAHIATFQAGTPARFQPAPGSRAMLVFSHTIGAPIVSLALAYRAAGNPSAPYAYEYDVENFHGVAALWDLRDSAAGDTSTCSRRRTRPARCT